MSVDSSGHELAAEVAGVLDVWARSTCGHLQASLPRHHHLALAILGPGLPATFYSTDAREEQRGLPGGTCHHLQGSRGPGHTVISLPPSPALLAHWAPAHRPLPSRVPSTGEGPNSCLSRRPRCLTHPPIHKVSVFPVFLDLLMVCLLCWNMSSNRQECVSSGGTQEVQHTCVCVYT